MFVFELFVSKYLSAGPVNQLDKYKPSALSTIKKPWNFKLLNAIFSTMFITSVYFLDCKRARICAKVENDRAGQTKGREMSESAERDCEERTEKYAFISRENLTPTPLTLKNRFWKKKNNNNNNNNFFAV